MDIQKIEKILQLIEKTGFYEVELEHADLRIKVRRTAPVQVVGGGQFAPQNLQPAPPTSSSATAEEENKNLVYVRSPLVGMFWRSPSPNAPHFVEIGDNVRKGQVLCIVEAMKLMNEVEAEADGKIVSIFIENAQPVEYGESLFLIEKSDSKEVKNVH